MNRRGVVLFFLIVCFAALAIGAYAYNRSQDNVDQLEAARNTYALCVVQNGNRRATRANTLSLYRLLAFRVKHPLPDVDPAFLRRERAELARLQAQLRALRPINCATYVRPDVPSDIGGVHSP